MSTRVFPEIFCLLHTATTITTRPITMSNVAEKARFHLERAVPQLREFEEKEIFSKVC